MNRKILVVDDELYVREALALVFLSIPEVEVYMAASAREAMRFLATLARVDALCTDLNMPLGDGFELIETVRADRRHARMPILVISANSEEATAERVKRLGADAYFHKPYSANDLRQTLEQLLDAQQNDCP